MIWANGGGAVEVAGSLAGLACFLFAIASIMTWCSCAPMLAGAAVVAIRRRQWKTLGPWWNRCRVRRILGDIPAHHSIIHRGSTYQMNQIPFFNSSILWYKLSNALTARSSAHPPDSTARRSGSGLCCYWRVGRGAHDATDTRGSGAKSGSCRSNRCPGPRHLALFCVVSIAFRNSGVYGFSDEITVSDADVVLRRNALSMRYFARRNLGRKLAIATPLGADSDRVAGGNDDLECKGQRGRSAHPAEHLDLIAAVLEKKASAGTNRMQDAWNGSLSTGTITASPLVTVPRLTRHKVHRNDLILEKLKQPDRWLRCCVRLPSTLSRSIVSGIGVYGRPAIETIVTAGSADP